MRESSGLSHLAKGSKHAELGNSNKCQQVAPFFNEDTAMKSLRNMTCTTVIALTALLAGCTMDFGGGQVGSHISIHDGNISVHARGAPDAVIAADGSLSIDGKAVTVTSDQRDLLKKYYAQAMTIRTDGIAIGKAGAAMAGHAAGAVASGLAHGNPDSIGPAIDARAADLEKKAGGICVDLATLRSNQEAVAAALPAFKPYASINLSEVSNCQSHHAG